MEDAQKKIAQVCLDGAENNTMTFPQIVGTLMQNGFESYTVDLRRASATYYRPNGDSVELAFDLKATPIADAFDVRAIQAAIKEAQELVAGYTYNGFLAKVMAGGCAGYMVSFSGRRALYYGRTAETHVELFPNAKQD